jgi:hypothetical protein
LKELGRNRQYSFQEHFRVVELVSELVDKHFIDIIRLLVEMCLQLVEVCLIVKEIQRFNHLLINRLVVKLITAQRL